MVKLKILSDVSTELQGPGVLLGWGKGAPECSVHLEEGQWAEGSVGHLGGFSLPPDPAPPRARIPSQ